jgi:hypothetical protein
MTKFNVSYDQFFEDGKKFEVVRQTDMISYPAFLKYFADLEALERDNLIIGINFTYAWMPTIFEFCSDKLEDGLEILNSAKDGNALTSDQLELLKKLFNNSLVGTSKLLHFIRPDVFAIWDSRVYRYLKKTEPYYDRISDTGTFLDYQTFCKDIVKQPQFGNLQRDIEQKVGYEMSPLRVAELVMYANGDKDNGDHA